MNFWNLKYFIDMAEQGSISAAARLNLVAQQSMSAQLKKLEEEYQTPLFIRSTPLQLTEAGKILYHSGKRILQIKEEADRTILDLKGEERALVIGFAFADIPAFFHEVLAIFQTSCEGKVPQVYTVQNCKKHPERLAEVDLYLSGDEQAEGLTSVLLLQDRVVVAVSDQLLTQFYPDNRERERFIATMQEEKTLRLMRELPFAFLHRDNGDNTGLPDPEELGLRNVLMRGNSMELQIALCHQGRCAVIMPEDMAQRAFAGDPGIHLFVVNDYRGGRELYISYRTDCKLREPMLQLIQIAEGFFARQR